MQLLLDHLTSLIVAGVLILGLQVTQSRSQHADMERVASHSVKAKTLVFGQWVENDILDIGANFGTNMYRFEDPETDADGNMTEWLFYSDSTRADGWRTRVFKRWRLVPRGKAEFVDGDYDVFRVERDSAVVDYNPDGSAPTASSLAAADWTLSYSSIETVSFFIIDLLDRTGETPLTPEGETDVYAVDYIRVRFGVVPEHHLQVQQDVNRSYHVRELYWSKTLKVRPYWVPPPSQS